MSFMSGFADAFGQQVTQGEQQRQQQQQDVFNMAYQAYLNKQSQYNASLKEDYNTVQNAKAAVSALGGAVPDGAWTYAYQWLKAGDDYGTVLQRLKSSTFASTQTPAMGETGLGTQSNGQAAMPPAQQNGNNLNPTMGSSPITAQTASQMDSGALGQGNTQPATQPTTTAPTNLMGNQPTLNDGSVGPSPQPQPQDQNSNAANQNNASHGLQFINPFDRQAQFKRAADQTSAQIKGLSGVDDNTFNAINSGLGYQRQLPDTGVTIQHLGTSKLTNPAEAIYIPTKNGVVAGYSDPTSPSGFSDLNNRPITDVTGSPMTNTQMDNNSTQAKDISTSMGPLLQQRGAVSNLANTAYQMQNLAKTNPVILTRLQSIPSFVNEGINEVNALKSIISNGGTSDQIDAQSQKVYGLVFNYLKNAGVDANAAQELATLKTQAVYALGQLAQGNGSSNGGNRMSDEDFNNFAKSLLDENDPAILSNKLKMMTKDYMRKNDNALTIQKSLPSNQIESKQLQYNIDSSIQPWETYIDPEAMKWLNSPDEQAQGNGPVTTQTDNSLRLTQQQAQFLQKNGYANAVEGMPYTMNGNQIQLEGN